MRVSFSQDSVSPAKNQENAASTDITFQKSAQTRKEPRRILYYDKDIVVAVKPAGILSLPGKDDAEDFLLYLRKLSPKTFSSADDLKLVHRLDRPVGGILLFTRSRRAERFFSPDGVKKYMQKTYTAVVCGKMPENSGVLHDYLLHDGKTNMSGITAPDTVGAVEAILQYEVLQNLPANDEHDFLQVVRIRLLTGRHHQIRIQLAHAGCPIFGDTKYNETFASMSGWNRMALFADTLILRHPEGDERQFSADPLVYEPEAFFMMKKNDNKENTND